MKLTINESDDRFADVLNQLQNEAQNIVDSVFTGPEFGYDMDEVPDVAFVDVSQEDHTYAKIEVRAEVSYEGLTTLMNELDSWVTKYDSDAYFDAEDVGITTAFVNMRKVKAMNGPVHR